MLNETKETTSVRKRLLARQAELAARSARLQTDKRRDTDPLSTDAPDRAAQLENDQVVDCLDDAVATELDAIGQALVRLDAGRYGVCATCGKPVGAKRLKAVPYADQCQSCMAQAGS